MEPAICRNGLKDRLMSATTACSSACHAVPMHRLGRAHTAKPQFLGVCAPAPHCPRVNNRRSTVLYQSDASKLHVDQQRPAPVCTASAGGAAESSISGTQEETYSLSKTRQLVETAMLAAVSGLAYLLSTIMKMENTLGYFLPLPVVIASLRSGAGTGWRTMMATGFLLVVLLGPIRAMSYTLLHGLLAATMGTTWKWKWNFWLSIVVCGVMRMLGQLAYLLMSSFTMNENLFALLLSNVFTMLDQVAAQLGMHGAPSTLAVVSMMFSLLLVNGLTYCFLVHAIYRVILGQMGFSLGPLPKIVRSYLYAGTPQGGSSGSGSTRG